LAAIIKPSRQVSFSDLAKANPRYFPADRLDSQIHNLIEAIHSTQQALAEIRRDDGKLKNHIVGQDQLATELRHTRGEVDDIERRVVTTAAQAVNAAHQIVNSERAVHLRALDAEAAAVSAAGFLSAVNAANELVERNTSRVVNLTDATETQATDAENWANYAQAHAQNAIANQQQAAAWSEYLAGPVVNPNDAPAYAQTTPFGHGLYYQPVEGGLAGLWSAKWWALYAQQLVGHWNFYYLGAWPEPPMPGQANPGTGLVTPDPLAPGSFYYNTETGSLYIWDGSQWTTPIKATPAYQANFVYVATAGQTVFSGPDSNNNIPLVTKNDSDVHLNGIRLVGGLDYTVDKDTSTLTLAVGATVNSIIQWDILVESSQLAPGAISVFKLVLTPAPDGTNKIFDMKYNNPTMGLLPIAASQVAEVAISIDGIVQEPAVDFTATGAVLTMASAPPADSRFWGTWHASDLILP